MELLYLLVGVLIGGTIGGTVMAVLAASSAASACSNCECKLAQGPMLVHLTELNQPAQMR